MPWSFRIFRIAGVGVYLHVTFILLLVIVGFAECSVSNSFLEALLGIISFLALFACVLAHEFGHILMARHFGIETRDVTLLPIGGVARLKQIPDNPPQELWVALAGPAVNVVIAALLSIWIFLKEGSVESLQFSVTHGGSAVNLMTVNLIMIGFNLLPAFPMDGGRVLRAFLACRMDYTKATRIAASLGRLMAVLFVFAGLFWVKNPFLIFIALVVWFGAGQEARWVVLNYRTQANAIRHVMIRDFYTAHNTDTLLQISQRILAGRQTDFPVVNDRGELVGMTGANNLLDGLKSHPPSAHVDAIMFTEFKMVDADQSLELIMTQYQEQHGMLLPVMDHGRLAGLLPLGHLSDLDRIREAFLERFAYLNLR